MIETFLFVRLGEGEVYRNVVWKLQLLLAIIVSFSYIYMSQGSVATPLRCGGMFTHHFVGNFPVSVPVKEL